MIKETFKQGSKTTSSDSFASLDEFYKYICDTPFNSIFRWAKHDSVENSENFTHSKDFAEAVDLFKHGWSDMSMKLENRLKVMTKEIQPMQKNKARYDIAGFQCSVPRYLQGVPTSMINTHKVPQKFKVITLNKDISYSSMISTAQIIESSTNSLMVVKKLEAQGYKVNLNLIWSVYEGNAQLRVKIRLKSAGERLNVAKIAFPLCHPSMLRRLLFRYEEVTPNVKSKSFIGGYGYPSSEADLQVENEYLLPKLVKNAQEIIDSFSLK